MLRTFLLLLPLLAACSGDKVSTGDDDDDVTGDDDDVTGDDDDVTGDDDDVTGDDDDVTGDDDDDVAFDAVGVWDITGIRQGKGTTTTTTGGSTNYVITSYYDALYSTSQLVVDIKADGTWGYTQIYTSSTGDTDYYGDASYTWSMVGAELVLTDGEGYGEWSCEVVSNDDLACDVMSIYGGGDPVKLAEIDLQRR